MKKIFLAVVFISSALAYSQTKLTVEDAVQFALKNNTSIERSEITFNALKREKAHSWNSVSPTISFGATANSPIDALSDDESKYKASFGISATLSLNLTANLYTQMQTAKYNYEIGEMTFVDALRAVELSVRQTFYGLLYEKENIVLQEKNLEIAQNQYNKNLQKYNAGRLSELDVLSSEVSYKEKIPTVENAKTTYENDLANFKQLLGLDINEEIELEGNLESMINLNEVNLDNVEIFSSTIKTLEKRIESAKNSVLDKRFSAYAPSLSARVNFSDQYWYLDYDDGKGGSTPDAKKSTSVTLSATVPLDGYLPWSTKSDNIEKAKDSLKDYELQLKNAKINLQNSINSSLRSIKQSQTAIKSKQANVGLAQRSYNMTYEAYNRGAKDLLSLQNANSSLLSAQVSLKNEIYNLIKTTLKLENEIGVPFGSLSLGENK